MRPCAHLVSENSWGGRRKPLKSSEPYPHKSTTQQIWNSCLPENATSHVLTGWGVTFANVKLARNSCPASVPEPYLTDTTDGFGLTKHTASVLFLGMDIYKGSLFPSTTFTSTFWSGTWARQSMGMWEETIFHSITASVMLEKILKIKSNHPPGTTKATTKISPWAPHPHIS